MPGERKDAIDRLLGLSDLREIAKDAARSETKGMDPNARSVSRRPFRPVEDGASDEEVVRGPGYD